jgi:cytochrome P450
MLATHSIPAAAGGLPLPSRLQGEIESLRSRREPAARRRRQAGLSQASALETLAIFLDVLMPTVAKGAIIRRPAVMAMAERLDLDRRAVRRLQRLRARHGTAPLMLRLPVRNQAVILDPAHVHRVLQQTPVPFSTASSEKRAALAHFEPKGALISDGVDRAVRRAFNEEVLGHQCPVHPLAADLLAVVEQEAAALRAIAGRQQGRLGWHDFSEVWARLVRRVTFGDGASEDHELSALMTRLRRRGNWAFLGRERTEDRERLLAKLRQYIRRAEPGSLAAAVAAMDPPARAEPEHQIPQWLFAFDPAGMTAARTLALLGSHGFAQEAARDEARRVERSELAYLRACALEALRLWPTTPMVLRQTTHETDWDGATMPAGTGVLVYAPFFHRDDQMLPYADRLSPELWLRERTVTDWPLIPFSEGSGVCPGRHVVLLLVSALSAALLERGPIRLEPADRLDPRRPLPATLNHFTLRFRLGG